MCGILGIFGSTLSEVELRAQLVNASRLLRHRGPDWSGYIVHGNNGIAHERLAIIDPESGAQPLCSEDGNIVVAANGEIYNYKELYASLPSAYHPRTGSDCEVVIPLASSFPVEEFPSKLRGMFSVIVYDKRDRSFSAFRVSSLSSNCLNEWFRITSGKLLFTLAMGVMVALGSPPR